MDKYTEWEKLRRRRRVLVDKSFQLDFVYRVACYSVFMMAVLGVGLFYPILRDLDSDGPWANESAVAILYVHEHIWPMVVLGPILCLLWSLQLSHKIAGPMVRIKRCLSTLSDGMIPEAVKLRPKDYMLSEVAQLNKMLESMSGRVQEIDAAEAELLESIHSCTELAQASGDVALRNALTKVCEHAKALQAKRPVIASSKSNAKVNLPVEAAAALEAELIVP